MGSILIYFSVDCELISFKKTKERGNRVSSQLRNVISFLVISEARVLGFICCRRIYIFGTYFNFRVEQNNPYCKAEWKDRSGHVTHSCRDKTRKILVCALKDPRATLSISMERPIMFQIHELIESPETFGNKGQVDLVTTMEKLRGRFPQIGKEGQSTCISQS